MRNFIKKTQILGTETNFSHFIRLLFVFFIYFCKKKVANDCKNKTTSVQELCKQANIY